MGQITITNMPVPISDSERLFLLFVFLVICVTLVRLIRVALRVWSFRRKRESLRGGHSDPEVVAKAALKGRIDKEASKVPPPNTSDSKDAAGYPALLFKVDCIDTRFLYLWETCYAKVQSTKTLTFLIVLLSFPIAAMGAINICNFFMTEETTGIAAASGRFKGILSVVMIALFGSAFLYALARWFEGILARRRTYWNYCKARFREEFSSSRTQ